MEPLSITLTSNNFFTDSGEQAESSEGENRSGTVISNYDDPFPTNTIVTGEQPAIVPLTNFNTTVITTTTKRPYSSESTQSAFFSAMQQNLQSNVQLKNPVDLTLITENGETAIHTAASHGATESLKDILLLPEAKKLIHYKDHEGNTPLHKATNKPEIVSLLIEHGAHVNAENNDGDIPLHMAARHGHAESAELLIKKGSKLEHPNNNRSLPFDLAVLHGKEDFFRFFLQTDQKTDREEKSTSTKDIEGNFYKLLLAAKKSEAIEEQILYLHFISYHYIKKGDLLRGSKILNCSLALFYKLPHLTDRLSILEQYTLYRLELIEVLFIESKGIKSPNKLPTIAEYRKRLKEIRSWCMKQNTEFQQYSKLLKEFAEQYDAIEELPKTLPKLFEGRGTKTQREIQARANEAFQNIHNEKEEIKGDLIQNYIGCKDAKIEIESFSIALTNEFKQILKDLIFEIQKIMGHPPVDWACMGMGSMSRYEMCPYSDLEFAFLIKEEIPEVTNYFRTLSQILELRIINLGETKFPIFGENYPSPTPGGFCMDTGGNTPLGVTGVYELIGTPKTLAQFQKIQWMNRSVILSNAMSQTCFVSGNEKLLDEYNKEKRKVQKSIDKQLKSQEKNHKVLAIRLLTGHLEEFSPDLSLEKEKIKAFGIKKELYRPIQEIIASLSLFYLLETQAKTTSDRIDELVKMNIFSNQGAENLKRAITQVLLLRLEAHLFYQNEEEFLCHRQDNQPLDHHLLYINEEHLRVLKDIYRILIPFHNCAKTFLTSKNQKAFCDSLFYDKDPSMLGNEMQKSSQYTKAKESYQQAISLNPNDLDGLLGLGQIESEMGDNQNALARLHKALELAKQEFGENHAHVAVCYSNIATVYHNFNDHEKAIEFYNKALNIERFIYKNDNQELACTYLNLGTVYFSLQDYDQALELYKKSLNIKLQVLGKNDPSVANCYNNLGSLYKELKNYKIALEYHKMALKIRLQIKNDPDLADSYHNIGSVYKEMKKYDRAIKYYRVALKIFQLKGNDNEVVIVYNRIAEIYSDYLQDLNQALKYYNLALKFASKVFGENNIALARIYSSMCLIYDRQREYKQALENAQKALAIQINDEEYYKEAAMTLSVMGVLCSVLGNEKGSIKSYQMALEILCPINSDRENILLTLTALVEEVTKALPESLRQSLHDTYELCAKTLGEKHEFVQKLSNLLHEKAS